MLTVRDYRPEIQQPRGPHQVKNLPAMQEMQETQVWSLGWEDPLEEEMVLCSSILAWEISMDRGACGGGGYSLQDHEKLDTTGHMASTSTQKGPTVQICFLQFLMHSPLVHVKLFFLMQQCKWNCFCVGYKLVGWTCGDLSAHHWLSVKQSLLRIELRLRKEGLKGIERGIPRSNCA